MDIEAYYKITYGLYIISSGSGNKINGYIGNTAFQVTVEPPQIAISCNKENFTASLIKETGYFSISVLEMDVTPEIISLFGYKSGKDINKFENTKYISGKSGVPVVTEDSIAWFECRLVSFTDVGSHIIFIGEIIDNELINPDAEPLTYSYYRNVRKGIAPKNAPTYINKTKQETRKEKQPNNKIHRCLACGYEYNPETGDPDGGIPAGTPFEDIPEDWCCPMCGATKDMFD